MILSRVTLINQGQCCGYGCRQCPYEKPHSGTRSVIRAEVLSDLSETEKKEINAMILLQRH